MTIALAARFFLGFLFLSAGSSKLTDRAAFIGAVEGYELLPRSISRPIGTWLPILEVLVGGALLVGAATRLAALAVAVLLTIFISAVLVSLLRGREIDCGCAGSAYRKITWWHVVKNGVLVILALATISAAHSPLSVDELRTQVPAGGNPGAFATLIAVSTLYITFKLLIQIRGTRIAERSFKMRFGVPR